MTTAVDRYIDRLLRRRRPDSFSPTPDEADLARAAITLLTARPGYDSPDPEFIDRLRHRVIDQDSERRPGWLADQRGEGPTTNRAAFARGPGRRRFLAAGALTAAGAAVGAVAERLLGGGRLVPQNPPQAQLISVSGIWQTVAPSKSVPEGTVLPFDLGAVTGFVRRASGRVQAVSGFCTHQGCRLDLDLPHSTLACPCHGATFSLTGQNLTRPADMGHPLAALPRLPVREQGGQIQVYAPAPDQI